MISFYMRALLLVRCPPFWNKLGATRTTGTSRHVTTRNTCRHMSWRNKWILGLSASVLQAQFMLWPWDKQCYVMATTALI